MRQLDALVIEIHCVCPADELRRRFAARARTAHATHPLTELRADLLAEYDRAMGIGEVIEVTTAAPVDTARLAVRVTSLLDQQRP